MNVPFNDLGSESRIWIYQSSRKLIPSEKDLIVQKTGHFLTEWTAHGHDLQAGMEILHDQFIVIGVNEAMNEASGCSIDKSVDFMRKLGQAMNLDLLDRSVIALKQNVGIELINFSEIRTMISEGLISSDSKIFNHAITTKSELEKNWEQPIKESWLKRYFT
jgi:hypothetical protein